jgi:DNA gyrase subunit B/topoisomerase-4 subunit B
VYFHPDATIFPKIEFDPAIIKERLEVASYLHKGLKVTFEDEAAKEKLVFEHSEGIVDYLRRIVTERGARPVHDVPFTLTKDEALRLDLVLQWTEGTDEHLRSYVNGIPTGSGGTHENGLRAGLGKAVRNFIETHNLSPKGVTIAAEDIREGATGVLSIFVQEPQFQGQTKDRLNNPELVSAIDGVVRPALEHWLNHNITVAEAIVGRIILAARAREASRAGAGGGVAQERDVGPSQSSRQVERLHESRRAKAASSSSSRAIRPAARRSRGAIARAGDSAAARQGAEHGKRVAGEGAREQGAVGSRHRDRLRASGRTSSCRDALRQVIILADADSDGNHIATLLLTFIYRHLPQLIANGSVFLAQPPLYRIDIGKDTHWALDDAHKAAILKQHGKNGRGNPEITRFKGLGEMMPKVLWETTLNPRTRRLLRVEVTDQIVTDRIINELMGKDASARFRFIMERADEAEELDV